MKGKVDLDSKVATDELLLNTSPDMQTFLFLYQPTMGYIYKVQTRNTMSPA